VSPDPAVEHVILTDNEAFFVYALGSALPVFTLSLVNSAESNRDQLRSSTVEYSATMIAKYTGNLVGLPIMTALWSHGIALGGIALGLPYFASAVCHLISIIGLSG
jgi:hypothetical protein